jgi:hypothetical protein
VTTSEPLRSVEVAISTRHANLSTFHSSLLGYIIPHSLSIASSLTIITMLPRSLSESNIQAPLSPTRNYDTYDRFADAFRPHRARPPIASRPSGSHILEPSLQPLSPDRLREELLSPVSPLRTPIAEEPDLSIIVSPSDDPLIPSPGKMEGVEDRARVSPNCNRLTLAPSTAQSPVYRTRSHKIGSWISFSYPHS